MRLELQTLENEIAGLFAVTTNYGAVANSTSTPIWFVNGMQASSTSYFATIGAGTWNGSAIGLLYGGTGATSYTTSGAALYYTGSAFATAPLTSAISFTYGSTTAISASGALYVPSVATCSSTSGVGFASVCFDTTNKQLEFTNLTNQYALSATSTKSFNIGSSTLDAMNSSFNTATSSFLLLNDPRPLTVLGMYCVASTTGTALIRLGDKVNWSNTVNCNSAYTPLTTNNTFTTFEDMVVQASSTAPNGVRRITVTVVYQETPQ